ncbi:glycosyltransferase family 2 protein [Clostridium fermenticellae]|uniref:Glycosyltransferase family 2 protein n=1 Tax=Clostridium fermenticellae TaxID=2068654 RepID=A0A386H076_9CLOT|nr:glycosyltransferase family 2 protein [Clostridium fermenticellae]AYD39067.1 glycosyltransferase family 2 protein [Clostridium fermenticellae]
MITISLCMIVKNEENVLERCLDSVLDIVDEINIIDTGSTDNTKVIARKYTNRLFDFKWVDDFSAARNESFKKATKDYILWMDADDVVSYKDRKKFLDIKQHLDNSVDVVSMNYNLAFDEYGNVVFSSRRNRLVKREKNFCWIGEVHEYLNVYGKIEASDISITHKSVYHDSDRNLSIYQKLLKEGKKFSPRDNYYFANELFDHKMYTKAAVIYEQFLLDNKGWVEDNISSCSKLADCYHELGYRDKELNSILRSFKYDYPRPEFCCRLGYYFLEKNNFNAAILWYKLAADPSKLVVNSGFSQPTFSTWLPHLQLCVCYYKIGNNKLAYLHNEVARQYRPNDKNILSNKEFFESILEK